MNNLQQFLQQHAKELVALGKQHGCTFTEDDVVAIAEGQLADEQLEGAAGGGVGEFGSSPSRNIIDKFPSR